MLFRSAILVYDACVTRRAVRLVGNYLFKTRDSSWFELVAVVPPLLSIGTALASSPADTERLAHLPAAIREERLVLLSSFVLRSVADRARALDAEEQHLGVQRRPQLDEEEFVTHLVGLVVAMLQAPGPDDGTAPAPGTRPGA